MNTRRIVITGGPGTGKSSIIEELKERGYICYEEISRKITLEARKSGEEQLFLTQPLRFSQLLLEGRTKQFIEAGKHDNTTVFLDRGLPDVLAYMDYFGSDYPKDFVDICHNYTYDLIFILAPWQEIFKSDSVRYETFEQSQLIHEQLTKSYSTFNYHLINIPFDTVEKRADFIIDSLNL